MKLGLRARFEGVTPLRVLLALTCAITIPLLAYAAAPDWWSRRGVIAADTAPDDYAPANIGQLKNIASAAAAEMDANLPGGAGDGVHNVLNGWSAPTVQTNDFAPLNVGQVKKVAKPFYDQLIAAGLADAYPWLYESSPADDFAIANIGQVKNLFAFEVPNLLAPINYGDKLATGASSATIAIAPNGLVWIWGDHFGTGSEYDLAYPRRFTGITSLSSVSAGYRHIAVLRADGTVWTWGENDLGQLGDGTTSNRPTPAVIGNLAGVTSIKSADTYTIALLQDGTVVGWGDNSYGNLGIADLPFSAVPVQVLGLSDVRAIAATSGHSLAIKNDGTLWAWGYSHYDGQKIWSATPSQVSSLNQVVNAAAGAEHFLAVQADGTLWSWGSNGSHQLGTSASPWVFQSSPMQVPNLTNVVKVAANASHSFAVLADGSLWAWGENQFGQLGDGTTAQRAAPVKVVGLTDVVEVAASFNYTLAMKADGTVWAWGDFAPGRLPGVDPHIPQQVTLGLLDSNSNGLDDRWELRYFGNLDQTASGDFDGDGISNLQEYLHHSDPTDYFNGAIPVIEIVSGNNQFGDAGSVAAQPLTVRVKMASGKLAPNAPVNFTVSSGDAQLLDASGSATQQITVRADLNGIATVRFAFGQLSGISSRISAAVSNALNTVAVIVRAVTRYQAAPIATPTPDPNATPTPTPSPTGTPIAPYRYTVVDLGKDVYPIKVNNRGTVLVSAADPNAASGWGYGRWRAGTIEHLTYNDSSLSAKDMNDQDTVVGSTGSRQAGTLNELDAGFRWPTGASGPQILSAPDAFPGFGRDSGGTFKSASLSAINNANDAYGQICTGTVMGYLYSTVLVMNGAIWPGGSVSPALLSDMTATHSSNSQFGSNWSGSSDTISRASRNHYVGRKFAPDVEMIPFPYSLSGAETGMIDGQSVDFNPVDVNDSGVVVGNARDSSTLVIRTLTTPPAAPAADATLPGAWPLAVNDHMRYEQSTPSTSPTASPSPIPAPQVLGWDGNTPVVWERQPDATWYGFGLEEMIPNMDGWQLIDVNDMNDSGMVVGTGWFVDPANPQAEGELHGIMLVPLALLVDGNRDGKIALDNSDDNTSKDRPYRFWLNDDDDTEVQAAEAGGAPLEVDTLSANKHDYDKHAIISKRNLEDFSRLWMYLGAFQDKLLSGQVQVGLRWKNVGSTTPAINIYPSADGEGSDSYLTDQTETAANAQLQGVFGNAVTDKNSRQTVDSSATFIFKADYWTGLTAANPKKCLLFEGAAEGSGELEIVLLDRDNHMLASGGSAWVDLKNIKKMYERVKVAPDTIEPPYDYPYPADDPPSIRPTFLTQSVDYSPTAAGETMQYIVFVHGWNQNVDQSSSYAETMFKRLWQRGYKGRFAAFQWPTYFAGSYDPSGFISARYNDSEYNAWIAGTALMKYVNQLPQDYVRSIAAHSMGNIVVAAAKRDGMLSDYHAMLHAAAPAYCYDPSPELEVFNTYVTPDHDNDPSTAALGYIGKMANLGGFFVNFYDSRDFALNGWEYNNAHFRSQRFNGSLPPTLLGNGTNGYYFDPDAKPGEKLGLTFLLSVGRFVRTAPEAFAFVDKSRSKTAGVQQIGGSVAANVNTDGFPEAFGTDHAAEWSKPLQRTVPFWDSLMQLFGVKPNP